MVFSLFARNNFLNEINQLITRCGNKAIYDENGNPKEPTLVRDLAKEIAFGLHSACSATFPKHDFQVHAIFCHQFPRVKFYKNSQKSCELGDLLFIFDEEDDKEKGNALLLQAKKINGLKFNPKRNEKTQLQLYTKAPEFTYILSKENRKLPNDKEFSGAQYLILFPPYDNTSQYRCVKAGDIGIAKPLVNIDLLGDCLVGLFSYDYGEKYDRSHNFSDDWSKIIHDFLDNLEEKNKDVFEQLQKRDYSTGIVFFQNKGTDTLDSSKLSASTVEVLCTKSGIATHYEYSKNIHNDEVGDKNNFKPFLMIHIKASEKK